MLGGYFILPHPVVRHEQKLDKKTNLQWNSPNWKLCGIKGGSKTRTMKSSVAAPSRPPKVTIGVRQAKYMKKNAAMHWTWSPSFKSLTYHFAFSLISWIRPPNSLPTHTHTIICTHLTNLISDSLLAFKSRLKSILFAQASTEHCFDLPPVPLKLRPYCAI